MDRERLQTLWENVHSSLTRKLGREALVFTFFLAVSAVFWFMQTMREDYEMELQVPVALVNVPEGVVVTQDLPQQITVKLKDRGSSLLQYYFDSFETVEFDFARHDMGSSFGHVVISHAEVQRRLQPFFEMTTRILSVHPDTLDYYYTRGVQRRMPIIFRGHLETAAGYYLGKITLDPDTVTVWGSEALLDSITSVSTMATNLTNLTTTLEQVVPIAVERGMKVSPAEVTLRADVDIKVEKRVRVPIVGTNFPAGYALRTFPSSAVVSFSVGSKAYRSITEENFVLTATYEELLSQPDSMLHLHLRSVPEGVSNVKITPDRVQYLIEQTDGE